MVTAGQPWIASRHSTADKARSRGLHATFLVWDALDLGSPEARFDTVLDSGLFHVFDDADRERFVESPGGPTGGPSTPSTPSRWT